MDVTAAEGFSMVEGFITLLFIVISGVGGLVVNSLKDSIKSGNKELAGKVTKLEEYLNVRIKDVEDANTLRVNKLEENSRRDDDGVKDLIKDAEDRSTKEMDRRISNVENLHGKIERESGSIRDKFEGLLSRLAFLEGKGSKSET
jgi:hypothetical protein